MSERLPALTGREVVRALRNTGFVQRRVNGSHHVLEHPGPPVVQVVVPVHGSRTIPKGTLRAILKQSALTIDEFIELLR